MTVRSKGLLPQWNMRGRMGVDLRLIEFQCRKRSQKQLSKCPQCTYEKTEVQTVRCLPKTMHPVFLQRVRKYIQCRIQIQTFDNIYTLIYISTYQATIISLTYIHSTNFNVPQYFFFFDHESMIVHLQETWKIQNKITYCSTIYITIF